MFLHLLIIISLIPVILDSTDSLDGHGLGFWFKPFQSSVAFHIETSQLFCRAKQMTGFYMKRKTGLESIVRYTETKFQN